jgi:hypothetical protein
MGDESKTERGFTIVDRRGRREEEAPPEPEAAPDRVPGGATAPPDEPGALPQIDFTAFALSLGTSALYHMGLVGDPVSGQPVAEKNLALARQTIDTLEMLEVKTRGNLDAEEARMLESLLYELRMRFLEVGP